MSGPRSDRRSRRRRDAGSFTVTGPELDRNVETAGVGVSIAQTHAARRGKPACFYIRDLFGNTVFTVERINDKGHVITRSAT